MWVRKRIEIGGADIASGLARCLIPSNRARIQRRLECLWSSPDDTLACLSVRSGLDLLLGALQLPRGSHLLMSSVNIGDMVRIIEHHGLVAVPVDLDAPTMAPTVDHLARALTPETKGILVAHLFGGQIAMDPIIEFARERGLLVIEDCAQAFDGAGFRGHPEADASLFSFGPIKTNTALGGALVRVRDPGVLDRMRELQAAYPRQSRWAYCRRLLKYMGIKSLSARANLALLVRLFRLVRLDYDRIAGNAARGFAGPGFFDRIRHQPSAALLALLYRRLKRFDGDRLTVQRAKAARLLDRLEGVAAFPGARNSPHTFWVFPIVVDNPEHLVRKLQRAGFDATQRQSLCVVPSPPDLPDHRVEAARALMDRIVYVPLYPEMPDSEIQRMAEIVAAEGELTDPDRFESLAAQAVE